MFCINCAVNCTVSKCFSGAILSFRPFASSVRREYVVVTRVGSCIQQIGSDNDVRK